MVKIAAIRGGTRAEGPGLRVAVWTQGCSIKCKGCFNPELWGTQGGEDLTPDELTSRIVKLAIENPGTQGVTFVGGEPFDQPDHLARVAENLGQIGLSVMVFTGFTIEELLERRDSFTESFLGKIDVLVDGRFDRNLVDTSRPWLGSSNQRFHLLSDRYEINDFKSRDHLEVTFRSDGHITVNGWARDLDLENLLQGLSDKELN